MRARSAPSSARSPSARTASPKPARPSSRNWLSRWRKAWRSSPNSRIAGCTPDEPRKRWRFRSPSGPNYFLEIAKLRAARTLWARAVESFRPADADAAKMTIYARTSHWTKTVYDPYVNLLRATTEAMAAAIGGADSLASGALRRTYREPDESSEPPGAQHAIDPEAGSLAGSLRGCRRAAPITWKP